MEDQSNLLPSFNEQIVRVYLRNYRKEARLVPIRTPIRPSQLLIIAAARFNVPEKRLVLFHNGFRIDNYDLPVELTQKSIVHVLDRRNLQVEEVRLWFKPHAFTGDTIKTTIPSSTLVKDVIRNHLKQHYSQLDQDCTYLVYLGKTLNPVNTLQQQFVEDGSQITILQHRPKKQAFQLHQSRHFIKYSESSQNVRMPVTFSAGRSELMKKKMRMAAQRLQVAGIDAQSVLDGEVQLVSKASSRAAPEDKQSDQMAAPPPE